MSVYFALASNGLMKIGFSENPVKRLSGLRGQLRGAHTIKLLAVVKGEKRDERKYHMRFGPCYSHGEWFFYKKELKDFVSKRLIPNPPQCGSAGKPKVPPPLSKAYIDARAKQLSDMYGFPEDFSRDYTVKQGLPKWTAKQRTQEHHRLMRIAKKMGCKISARIIET